MKHLLFLFLYLCVAADTKRRVEQISEELKSLDEILSRDDEAASKPENLLVVESVQIIEEDEVDHEGKGLGRGNLLAFFMACSVGIKVQLVAKPFMPALYVVLTCLHWF